MRLRSKLHILVISEQDYLLSEEMAIAYVITINFHLPLTSKHGEFLLNSMTGFVDIKNQSNCTFAKIAKVITLPIWNENINLGSPTSEKIYQILLMC